MSPTLDVSCPNCDKALKVPAELAGKRVKCKGCQEVFAVPAPAPAKPAAKPPAKPAAAKPAAKPPAKPAAKPPAAPAAAKPPVKKPHQDDDDDDEGARPAAMGVIAESDIPRCPHCAYELDPPDAELCLNCGFNNRTRVRAESKRTVAPDATDWVVHLAPGILSLLIVGGLVTLCVLCWVNMGSWLEGSFLESEEKNALTGERQFLVKPGAFTAIIIAFSLLAAIPAARFAVKRLVLNARPEEKVSKK